MILASHLGFPVENMIYIMDNPIHSPLPYPIRAAFQKSFRNSESFSSSSSPDVVSFVSESLPQPSESGNPRNLSLPSYELFSKERFKTSREVREANCAGISPTRWLPDRSNDSTEDRLPSDDDQQWCTGTRFLQLQAPIPWLRELLSLGNIDSLHHSVHSSFDQLSSWLSNVATDSLSPQPHGECVIEVEPLKMRELEETAIGVNLSYKTTATEIKLNHMASHFITYDSIP
uniref:Uncharacterized protein n=1 Tax=Solanum lycopersicum TaxID=4081 RepID=A0A3Q7JFU1_SOLLC